MNENLNNLAETIVSSSEKNKGQLKKQFMESSLELGVRYFNLDQLLPEKVAYEIFESFPKKEEMRKMSSFWEKKYTSKNFDQFKPLLADITFAIQDSKVISLENGILW
jgi:hypothetical protein